MAIHVLHLSRTDPLIEAADVGSRHFDKDDWGIDRLSFDALESLFGRAFKLDPFASPANARCARFFSRYANPGARAVDAFSVSWDKEILFACPPIGKILSTWKKICVSLQCSGVLVFPVWKSCNFWPILFKDGRHGSWPGYAVRVFKPRICLGTFYAGTMNGHNDYSFIALFFDTSLFGPNVPLCASPPCSCFS